MYKEKQKLESKKAVVMTRNRKPRVLFLTVAVVCLAVSIFAASWYLKSEDGSSPIAVSAPKEEIVDQITYPVSSFDDGKAAHFEYTDHDITVRYFVLKSADGVVRAAFDACDVCWPAGKGYAQEGDDMICRNCGRRFPSISINEVEGGCNPAPLARKISGDNLVIRVEDILEGKKYFDFTKS